jgi:hypothetical protein
MSLEHAFFVSQIIASIALVASLIFVGLQVRGNTTALQRNEHNSTMAQWTVIRMAVARNRDIAELMTDGLHGRRRLDHADQLRLEQMLQENAWACFHTGRSAVFFQKGRSSLRVGHFFAACSRRSEAVHGGAAPSISASFLHLSGMSTRCSPRRMKAPSCPQKRNQPPWWRIRSAPRVEA